VDVCLVIKQRLRELGFEQQDLAAAAKVTESYISQLLTGKKLPPSSGRTDIYGQMEVFLKLPGGKLSALADAERKEALKRELADLPTPLLKEVRESVLRKCTPDKEREVRAIFEKQPFGELERLVTQKLLDVVKKVGWSVRAMNRSGSLASNSWTRMFSTCPLKTVILSWIR
jgi:transcriptional regulator with XRE-family HTH domain